MKCLVLKLFSGTGHTTKLDEFSERFQTAVDPHPSPPSEWSLSLCTHFILSGPRTSLHIFDHIHYRKDLQHNFPKMRGALGIFPKISPIWQRHPSLKGTPSSSQSSSLSLHHFSMLLDKSGKKWASWRDGRVKRVLDIPAQGHQGSRAQYGCCQNMLPRVYNNKKRALHTNNNMNEIICQNIL